MIPSIMAPIVPINKESAVSIDLPWQIAKRFTHIFRLFLSMVIVGSYLLQSIGTGPLETNTVMCCV